MTSIMNINGIEVVREFVDGGDTWTWTNPRTGDRQRLKYWTRDRLLRYVDHGKSGQFYWDGNVDGIKCGDRPDIVAAAWIAASAVDWKEVGRQAFENGEHAAPALNATVMAAIENLPVGGGAAAIMQAFSDGWTAANLAAPVDMDENEEEGIGSGNDVQ